MRKEFYGILPLALTSCLASQTTAQEKQTQRPNVVFIYADDIGYGDLSCNGAKTIHTPNVERLAKMGVRFTNAHSAAATSTPSRYAMLTGEYAWRKAGTGIAAGDAAAIIRPERYTMANLFKDAGYNTGVVGKWHLGLGDKGGEQDWNKPLQPGTNDIGFEYSFIMAATSPPRSSRSASDLWRIPARLYSRGALIPALWSSSPGGRSSDNRSGCKCLFRPTL